LPPAIAHTTNHIRNILSGGFFSSLLGCPTVTQRGPLVRFPGWGYGGEQSDTDGGRG
jgi:hypothetical protein